MNSKEQARFNKLCQQHPIELKLQGPKIVRVKQGCFTVRSFQTPSNHITNTHSCLRKSGHCLLVILSRFLKNNPTVHHQTDVILKYFTLGIDQI